MSSPNALSPNPDVPGNPHAGIGPLRDIGPEARAKLEVKKVKFDGNLLIIGCGAVASSALPLIPRLIEIPWSRVTVIDVFDVSAKIQTYIDQGLKFVVEKVSPAELSDLLARYVKAGDAVVDLAYEIPTTQFLEWCRANDVLFINAALELDVPYFDAQTTDIGNFTLYKRHWDTEQFVADWSPTGPTALIEHGANPGIISHIVRLGLKHIAEKIIAEKPEENPARTAALKDALEKKAWNYLAMHLGVKVIHVAERDTQVSSVPKKVNEFVNTWSPQGFLSEAVVPAELGWGTHEKEFPPHTLEHTVGDKHMIAIKAKSVNVLVRSWVPLPHDSGDIIGMAIPHGEDYTVTKALTVKDENGKAIYRPTVHYAYCPCDAAIASILELKMRGWSLQPQYRVMKDELTDGADYLGALIMGHDYGAWWIGSTLSLHEVRQIIPGQNATVLPVAIGVVTGLAHLLSNPKRGVIWPEDLPPEEVISQALPFLGAFMSFPVSWDPIQSQLKAAHLDYRNTPEELRKKDPWQFSSFAFND